MKGFVMLNAQGQYLEAYEVSSFSSNKLYHYRWGDLNRATVFRGKNLPIKWKEDEPEIVGILPATEIRTVVIGEAE